MWKQKIGISIGNHYDIPTPELVRMLSRIGFDAISPEWEPGGDLEEIVSAAGDCALSVQSLHAPYRQAASLWSDDEFLYTEGLEQLMEAVDDCVLLHIPTLVLHTWIGFDYEFNPGELYFGNYDAVVNYAAQKGVQIAFENTEGEEYLYALMEHYRDNPNVGFCWDSGHELCYNRSRDLLADLGDRLIMTHLNDNLGISRHDGYIFWTDDLHLLPYDGIADWEDNIARLRRARKQEILNFELNITSKPGRHDNDCYAQMPLEQYFTEAYKRACRIAYRYSK